MARRRAAVKREITGDPVYNDATVQKFINIVMRNGKKSISEKIIYGAFDIIASRQSGGASSSGSSAKMKAAAGDTSILEVIFKAIENVSPLVEVKAKRVGGSTYQVPFEIRGDRGKILAMRWLIAAAIKRHGKSLSERLAAEILDAVESRGEAIKRKEEMHRNANANKAFAHYSKQA